MKEVFNFVGLEISAEEKKAIDFRNRTLHGRRTMQETTLAAVTEETKRFDVLRTLINKALLRLIDYDGPYMDYGTPAPSKSFSVKVLDKRSPASDPVVGRGQT